MRGHSDRHNAAQVNGSPSTTLSSACRMPPIESGRLAPGPTAATSPEVRIMKFSGVNLLLGRSGIGRCHRGAKTIEIGRDDWIRTSDPLTPSQVRYQAAPHPAEYLFYFFFF